MRDEVALSVRLDFTRERIEFVRRGHASKTNPSTAFTSRFVRVVRATTVSREIREVRAVKEYGDAIRSVFVDWILGAKASHQECFPPANATRPTAAAK